MNQGFLLTVIVALTCQVIAFFGSRALEIHWALGVIGGIIATILILSGLSMIMIKTENKIIDHD